MSAGKSSFKKPKAVEAPDETEVLKPVNAEDDADDKDNDESHEVAEYDQTPIVGHVSGEVDATDFNFPRLQLCQNIGPLVEEHGFTPGDLVLGQDTILYQPDCDPVDLVILSVRKRFQEVTEYGSDEMPRLFDTAKEVQEAGLSTGFPDPTAKAICDCIVLIKYPGDPKSTDEEKVPLDHFGYEAPDGTLWALSTWRIAGAAYKVAGRKIFTTIQTKLGKVGILGCLWTLAAKKEKSRRNTYWGPVLKTGEFTTDEFREWCKTLG